MEKKLHTSHDELKLARSSALKRAAHTSIQPRGKYHGFDVFTWLDAPKQALISTFEYMPYPIHWVCTANYFNVLVDSGHAHFPNVESIFLLEEDAHSNLVNPEIVVESSLTKVLSHPNLLNSKGILLISGAGGNGIDAINEMSLILKTIHGS